MPGFSLPRPRQFWRQVHSLAGITAGTLLMLIGLSGALLAFREEAIDWLNPGGRHVAGHVGQAALAPPQLLAAVQRTWPGRPVGTLAVSAEPGAAARVIFAPQGGQRRGETVYLDPATARPLPPLAGAAFFETVESLHRWLLLPREPGRIATGILAAGLLGLALSGLYLRWPRRPLDWRAWFTFNTALRGRAFLWNLHAVAGTCALLPYLVLTTTGLYWAFDVVRERVDALATASAPPARPAPRPRAAGDDAAAGAVDIGLAWAAFEQRARAAGGWSEAIVRVQRADAPAVLFTWLDARPAHERARNRTTVRLRDGEVLQDERHAEKPAGGRFLAAIYPLHMGSYFGLAGRVAMALAALALPAFGLTGWMLFLLRRQSSACNRQRRAAGAAS
ncbi:PepSY-associated TM helix domain-containing protein [Pseudorhodoferax sp.]|uniref:PepSY-associated TM helix domain-containing protein n=1 Tax=Pseudorhodoferax sp. TaxID=1993553 RepID=UPI0039E383B7